MRILVAVNQSNIEAREASLMLGVYLQSQNIDTVIMGSDDLPEMTGNVEAAVAAHPQLSQPIDMVIVLGGDGSILRASRVAHIYDAPILGINFGHLGFLPNDSADGVTAIVAAALAGDCVEECRTNLSVEVYREEEDEPAKTLFTLNEVAVSRGCSAHIVDFDLMISGDKLASMRGDGVVVATATGSTAYALSAGGPLVAPGFRGLVVVPLSPHTLQSRALVTEANDIIEIELTSETSRGEASLFLDGEAMQFEDNIERVIVRRGDRCTRLLLYKSESFYKKAARVFF